MAFWFPIGLAVTGVMLAEAASAMIGTPEAALVGRLLEGGIVFWCLYHLFTKTFPEIQSAHASNVERVCDAHEKACEVHQETMSKLTDSMRDVAQANTKSLDDIAQANRDGMEGLRKEWSDTRNCFVEAIAKNKQ